MSKKQTFTSQTKQVMTNMKEAITNTDINDYKMKKTWPLGFISFFGFPSLANALSGKEFSPFFILTLAALVFFVPVRRTQHRWEITKEELDYYRKNPDEISLINNATSIRYKYLTYAFILGFILVVLSKLAVPALALLLSTFWSEVLRDLLFELGVALWGGAITTFIMELHALKEEQDCKRKQDMLRSMLELDTKPPSKKKK